MQLAEIVAQNKTLDNCSTKIEPALADDYSELTEVWEASVRATHHFLAEEDIQFFKPLVLNEYLKAVKLYCVKEGAAITGFIGLSLNSIEMLFVHPDHRGKRIGKHLTIFATSQRGVKQVDVNEQNLQALGFYEQMGFKVVGRSEVDGTGRPYPLLHMELTETH